MNGLVWVAAVAFLLALGPAVLFIRNLSVYSILPPADRQKKGRCSLLIPARNEEANIGAAVRSVLQNRDVDCEVLVLDDDSSDATAEIVREIAKDDPRVQLGSAPALPSGWSGKQHACHILGTLARHPLLVFMDADVRLAPDALARIGAFMEKTGVALASSVPRQETETFSERLLLPLIHFILLGFLPVRLMRQSRSPALAAGCGQLFVARRDAYIACGGHRALRGALHDGTKLPRIFRAAGFSTDLFDATDLAVCRMYRTNAAVWSGLARTGQEALGSPAIILPATILLLGGQVLPLVLLFSSRSPVVIALSALGTLALFLPRLIAIRRFGQPLIGALLHPLGICALLAIQWWTFFRAALRRPATWKSRSYQPA